MSGYWLLVPLILCAIIIRNWVESPATLLPEAPMAISESQADYLLEDFSTRHYDESGTLAYNLRGVSLAHYPDDGRAEINQPELVLTRDDARWHATADIGQFRREPDTVTLMGEVRIDRTLSGEDKVGPVTIITSNVAINVDSDELSTNKPVRIEAQGLVLEANGLQSSMKAGKLELLSGVTARYEVARPIVVPAADSESKQ